MTNSKKLYQVKSGDTLSKIAGALLGDTERWKELAYINSIKQPYLILPDQVIMVPSNGQPIEVVVTRGTDPGPMGPPTPERVANAPPVAASDPFMLYAGLAIGAVLLYLYMDESR